MGGVARALGLRCVRCVRCVLSCVRACSRVCECVRERLHFCARAGVCLAPCRAGPSETPPPGPPARTGSDAVNTAAAAPATAAATTAAAAATTTTTTNKVSATIESTRTPALAITRFWACIVRLGLVFKAVWRQGPGPAFAARARASGHGE